MDMYVTEAVRKSAADLVAGFKAGAVGTSGKGAVGTSGKKDR